MASPSFAELGLDPRLLAVVAAGGIDTPFPVQTATIPDILAGRDVAAQAPTGSGKTLAFGLPIIHLLQRDSPAMPGTTSTLVLVPTRELARQISDVLAPMAQHFDQRVHTFYGGVAIEPQVAACERGLEIAVACPGRLLDLIERGNLSLTAVKLVVVDEADRMADMGFLPDVRRLLAMTASDRQTLLFSATLDGDVDVLIRDHQLDPVRHLLQAAHGRENDDPDRPTSAVPELGMPALRHHLWSVYDDERTELTAAIVDHCGPTMVFVRTRHGAERLAKRLNLMRIATAALHGGNSQIRRDQALDDFRAGRLRALVATDVAARGVHVDGVACVVQYDLPVDPKDYVHRAGRTARAGASGAVVTLVTKSMHGRARDMMVVSGHVASPAEAVIERADLSALESAEDRRLIDRELAALQQVRRPGAVGAVVFDRPRAADVAHRDGT